MDIRGEVVEVAEAAEVVGNDIQGNGIFIYYLKPQNKNDIGDVLAFYLNSFCCHSLLSFLP